MRRRLEAARTRSDTRDWAQARRARTRQLIELGGLVQKAGLPRLLDNDQATLLGALLELARHLTNEGRTDQGTATLKARWQQRGMQALEAEAGGG